MRKAFGFALLFIVVLLAACSVANEKSTASASPKDGYEVVSKSSINSSEVYVLKDSDACYWMYIESKSIDSRSVDIEQILWYNPRQGMMVPKCDS